MWKNSKLLRLGIVGTFLTALCCFTPILVVLLGLLGLAGLIRYLDYLLLPVLVIFIGITVFAYQKYPNAASIKNK
ncbi:MAG: mercury resistance system transport protein MerF [Anaerolineae bacterium]